MIEMKEIEKMDSEALERKITEVKKNLFNLRIQKKTTGIEKPHMLKVWKKDLARILTFKNKKKG